MAITQDQIIVTIDSCIRLSVKNERTLNDERATFESSLDGKIPATLASFDDDVHPPEVIDEYWDLYTFFPSIHRRSEVINAYSILEHGLRSLCDVYERKSVSNIKLNDLAAHGYVDKSKKYLEKVINIEFPVSGPWEDIKYIQQLRNKLVHEDGVINTNNKELFNYIGNHSMLELDNSNRLIILAGYTEECYSVIRHFFFNLFSSLPKI
ncbi:hypothetical protein P4S67_19065 [Pseudoalteromonas sp. B137]